MPRLSIKQSEFLKLSAVLFMIIDHIGLLLFPDQVIWRIIGRLAFPLFAFQVALACKYSRNLNKYISLLVIFAAVAQIPFMLALQTLSLNVLFTFLLSVLFIASNRMLKPIILLIAIGCYFTIGYDYGLYGFALVLAFYYIPKWPVIILIMGFMTMLFPFTYIQWFAIGSLLYILLVSKVSFRRIPSTSKYFFYCFYPLQFIILLVIVNITR